MPIRRVLIGLFGVTYVLTGLFILIAPRLFYDTIPGLDLMGPFNMHFIRDVGLTYLAGGGAMAWAALRSHRAVARAGATWFAFHALFHLWIWMHRSFALDLIFGVDLLGVILPGLLGLWLAWRWPAAKDDALRTASVRR